MAYSGKFSSQDYNHSYDGIELKPSLEALTFNPPASSKLTRNPWAGTQLRRIDVKRSVCSLIARSVGRRSIELAP